MEIAAPQTRTGTKKPARQSPVKRDGITLSSATAEIMAQTRCSRIAPTPQQDSMAEDLQDAGAGKPTLRSAGMSAPVETT